MSCYRPMLGRLKDVNDGVPHYELMSMNNELVKATSEFIQIPCGKCIGCRLDHAQMWSNRLILESKCHEENYFVTLSYDDDNIPACYINLDDGSEMNIYTLKKEDAQNFFKHLRMWIHRECIKRGISSEEEKTEYKIKYFLCGEYGDNTSRPHMHAIIFNLHLPDVKEKAGTVRNKWGNRPLESEILNKIWRKGFVELGPVTPETCGYVARYTLKKIDCDPDQDIIDEREKEFLLMSRRPGIGKEYFLNHQNMFDTGKAFIGTENGSIEMNMPRYFRNMADSEVLRRNRKRAGYISRNNKNNLTDLDYIDRLRNEEKIKNKVKNILKRDKI